MTESDNKAKPIRFGLWTFLYIVLAAAMAIGVYALCGVAKPVAAWLLHQDDQL